MFGNSEICIGELSDGTQSLISEDFDPEIYINERARERHMHVIGANGSGKSRFLRSLIQQDIRNSKGVCLIDPHGTLCDDVVKWLAERPLLAKNRNVRLFNIGKGEDILPLNPLAVGDVKNETSTVAMRLADAIGRLFTEEELQKQPLTFEVLIMLFVTLAEHGMTLADYHILLNPKYKEERKYLVNKLYSANTREQWKLLDNYKDNEFVEYVSSVSRRLYTLLENPIINKTFSVKKNAFNFRRVMDEGDIILINLRDTKLLDPTSAQLLGLLLISSFFNASTVRDNLKPFYLYIDEAHRYLSGRMAEIFEQCRKYGLHLILAHQNLGQLRDAGDRVFSTVMNEAAIKVVFRINEPNDADYMARTVFGSRVDPNKVKDVLTKPTVVGYTIETLTSYSEAESYSEFESESTATGTAENSGMSVTQLPSQDALGKALETLTDTSGTASSTMHGSTDGRGSSWSSGMTHSPTVLPVYKPTATATWSVEEQLFVLSNELSSLPIQYGVISIKAAEKKKKDQPKATETLEFKARDVPDLHTPDFIVEEYLEDIRYENPYLLSNNEALNLVDNRQESLVRELKKEGSIPTKVREVPQNEPPRVYRRLQR